MLANKLKFVKQIAFLRCFLTQERAVWD